MNLLATIMMHVTTFADEVRKELGNGVSFNDAKVIMRSLKNHLVVVAQEFDALGPDKKEAVLSGIETFYDLVVVPYDIPWVPEWIEKPMETSVRGSIRPIFGPLIDEVVDFAHVIAKVDVNPWKKVTA